MVDVSDGISIGLAWPPKMTTICPLGPSAVSPILALKTYFRDEVDAHMNNGCPLKSVGAGKSGGTTPRPLSDESATKDGRSSDTGASEGVRGL